MIGTLNWRLKGKNSIISDSHIISPDDFFLTLFGMARLFLTDKSQSSDGDDKISSLNELSSRENL